MACPQRRAGMVSSFAPSLARARARARAGLLKVVARTVRPCTSTPCRSWWVSMSAPRRASGAGAYSGPAQRRPWRRHRRSRPARARWRPRRRAALARRRSAPTGGFHRTRPAQAKLDGNRPRRRRPKPSANRGRGSAPRFVKTRAETPRPVPRPGVAATHGAWIKRRGCAVVTRRVGGSGVIDGWRQWAPRRCSRCCWRPAAC